LIAERISRLGDFLLLQLTKKFFRLSSVIETMVVPHAKDNDSVLVDGMKTVIRHRTLCISTIERAARRS